MKKKNKPIRRRKCKNCKEYFRKKTSIKHKQFNFCTRECKKLWLGTQPPTAKDLDGRWSYAVKERAGFKCEYCGKEEYLNSHHIYSRSNTTLIWDLDNGICLCAGHHTFSTFSAHKSPMDFSDWIREKRGEKWYQDLKDKARVTTYIKDVDTQEVYINLTVLR